MAGRDAGGSSVAYLRFAKEHGLQRRGGPVALGARGQEGVHPQLARGEDARSLEVHVEGREVHLAG